MDFNFLGPCGYLAASRVSQLVSSKVPKTRSFRLIPALASECFLCSNTNVGAYFEPSSNTRSQDYPPHRNVVSSPAGPPANLCRSRCTPSHPTYVGFDGPLPFPNRVPCGLGPAGNAGRSDTTPRERQSSSATGSTINLCIFCRDFDRKMGN